MYRAPTTDGGAGRSWRGRRHTAGVDIETASGRSRADFRVPLTPDQVLARLRTGVAAEPRFTLVQADTAHADLTARFNRTTWGGRIHLRYVRLDAVSSMVVGEWHPTRTARSAFTAGEDDLRVLAAMLDSAEAA